MTYYERLALALEEGQHGPSDDLRDRMTALFRRRAVPRPWPAIEAELVLDSRLELVGADTRSAAVTDRQILYQVEGYDVDLRIRPGTGRNATFTGQILPSDGSFLDAGRLQAWLTGPDGEVTSLPVTGFGEFRAGNVSLGEQCLELVVDTATTYRITFTV